MPFEPTTDPFHVGLDGEQKCLGHRGAAPSPALCWPWGLVPGWVAAGRAGAATGGGEVEGLPEPAGLAAPGPRGLPHGACFRAAGRSGWCRLLDLDRRVWIEG